MPFASKDPQESIGRNNSPSPPAMSVDHHIEEKLDAGGEQKDVVRLKGFADLLSELGLEPQKDSGYREHSIAGATPVDLDITQLVEPIAGSTVICTASADTRQGWYTPPQQNGVQVMKVALKHLRHNTGLDSSKMQKRFNRELQIWRDLDHPNVLQFLGTARLPSVTDHAQICFVSPWMQEGNVIEFLEQYPNVDRLNLIGGIADGMEYLHGRTPSLVHGDIKGKNVLINESGVPVLCDFGLAAYEELERATTTLATHGTMRWMAPERLSPDTFGLTTSKTRTTTADVYSFGLTAYEILSGQIPFYGKSDWDAILAIVAGNRPPIPSTWKSEIVQVIQDCWQQQRSQRPTATQISKRVNNIYVYGFVLQDTTQTMHMRMGYGPLLPALMYNA
ncbi:kinase-like protein [Calocera cornea HHB12733]|uniref:Kinase-like protein n=1 Tax=Calocera cornea HHB12733 TaxID=1353952 RepID=A0A165E163_9BASI|nr:kinase-like protein [Calocera cornea HHB12733]